MLQMHANLVRTAGFEFRFEQAHVAAAFNEIENGVRELTFFVIHFHAALAARVGYAIDADSAYPAAYSAALEVRLHDGRRYFHRESINRGARDNPLTRTEIVAKFDDNVLQVSTREHAARIASAVESLDSAPNLDALVAALAAASATMQRA